MADIEREKAVADAIILERAIRVIERRQPCITSVRAVLTDLARDLRYFAGKEDSVSVDMERIRDRT